MKFRTEIKISDAPKNMSPERLVLLMGSCFSDNIGGKINETGWPAVVNPCGVLYNPVSLAIMFQLALTHRSLRREIIASSLTEREGKTVSWFMGSLSMASSPEECCDKVCEAVDALEEGIENAQSIIITFGTSDVWLLKGTDRAVGNCHKHPTGEFERRRLAIDEIVETWRGIIKMIRERNPEVSFIFTVSPRRYLSEGFAENTRQKAILILACEALCKTTGNCFYFPAYEIMNDDLRDYRFYKPDLLHPSEMAVEYIWDKFKETYLDQKGLEMLAMMEKESRRNRHRSIQDNQDKKS